MKNKILIIILIILIVMLAIIGSTKLKKNNNSQTNQATSRNFILHPSTTTQVNSHGENSGIYVGVTEQGSDNYLLISIFIDKNASQKEQIRSLISAISSATGYTIDINSIDIDGNNIKIDLAKTAAPFELTESYNDSSSKKYYIATEYAVAKTLLDSINKTLKSYFGNNVKIYLSADSENITIENEIIKIHVDATKPYDEQ